MSFMRLCPRIALLAAALLATPAVVSAQVYTGRIDVLVADATGGVLPGTTIELSGPHAETAVTDAAGDAHFLNLPVGSYQVTATLQGFLNYRNDNVYVGAGSVVPLRVTLALPGVAETVTVIGSMPVVEIRKQMVATNVTAEELRTFPRLGIHGSCCRPFPASSWIVST